MLEPFNLDFGVKLNFAFQNEILLNVSCKISQSLDTAAISKKK